MKHKKQLHYLLILLLFGIISCKDQQKTKDITAEEDPKKEKGLKDYFAEDFPMGVAVSPASLEGKSKELILAEYNSLTPENVMKMGIIHPKKDEFNWAPADRKTGLKYAVTPWFGINKPVTGFLKMARAMMLAGRSY